MRSLALLLCVAVSGCATTSRGQVPTDDEAPREAPPLPRTGPAPLGAPARSPTSASGPTQAPAPSQASTPAPSQASTPAPSQAPAPTPSQAHTPSQAPDPSHTPAPTHSPAHVPTGTDVITAHLAAGRIAEAFAFAEALAPDVPPLDTVLAVALPLSHNHMWLLSFPLDTPQAQALAPRLAEHAAATLGPCDSKDCDLAVRALRRLEPFLAPDRRAGLQGELFAREMKLASWREPRPAVFGVLLPLSGPFESFGRAAREALTLASSAFPGVSLVFRDTTADPTVAEANANAMIFEDRVSAIIGPVGRQESSPVIALARRWGIAHLPLTLSVEALDVADDPVLRLRTSPVELAVALARYVQTELRLVRVAVLVADDPSFREQADAFAAELTRLGATVVRTIAFDPNAKGFEAPLGALVQSTNPRRSKVDFDALYVAAPGATARRLASHLAFWGVPLKTRPDQKRASKKAPNPVQLLGSWGWSTSQILDRTTQITNNAIFPEVFAQDLADEVVIDFVRRFYLAHNKRPTGFQAEVFDALRVAIDAELEARTPQLEAPTPTPEDPDAPLFAPAPPSPPRHATTLRERLVAALLRERNVALATGTLTVINQKALPRTHLMTVDGDTVRTRLPEDEETAVRKTPRDESTDTPPENPRGPVLR